MSIELTSFISNSDGVCENINISILARVEKNCPLFNKSEFTNEKRFHKNGFGS